MDGFNLNDDEDFLSNQFNRRKGSNYVDGSTQFESKNDSFIQNLSSKIEKIEGSSDSVMSKITGNTSEITSLGAKVS